jgi:hypothetical protein
MSVYNDTISVMHFDCVELEVNLWDTAWLEVFILSDVELEALLV